MHRQPSTIAGHAALYASLIVAGLLSACGGGGGGESAASTTSTSTQTTQTSQSTQTPQASAAENSSASTSLSVTLPSAAPTASAVRLNVPAGAPSGLFISEVASNVHSNTVSWLEVYNNTGAAMDLSKYSLRTPAINLGTQAVSDSVSFALPQHTLPDNSYLVIGAQASTDLQNGSDHIYIANASQQVPYWQGLNGFAELISNGATVDFVRFGSSTAQPTTSGAWSGPAVVALPNSATDYNTSIVRPFTRFTQTHTAGDWSAVNFATPGGINDVAAGVSDSDGDGIPDSAKLYGGTYGGLDLYAMGARQGQRDLFIHLDYLSSNDPGVTPDIRALDKIVQAFAKRKIAVHFDAGNLFSTSLQPAQHNLSGDISHQRPAQRCSQLRQPSQLQTGCTSVYATKTASMDIRRKPIFRYLLMASSQQPSGLSGASGSAELVGDDFLVTLGGWGLQKGSWLLANYQAATIMHELGHTLGLRHGGNEDEVAKPNYFSTMNYLYQISGLPSLTGNSFNQRYYYWLTNYQNQSVPGYSPSNPFPESLLDDGPQSASFRIDYSDGSSLPLNENNLNESVLIGRGTVAGSFADWNTNGTQDSANYAMDINQSGSKTELRDYNDWANLVINPRRQSNANNSGIMLPGSGHSGSFDPLTTPFQPLQSDCHPLLRPGQMQHSH